jgi:hypothetical protein
MKIPYLFAASLFLIGTASVSLAPGADLPPSSTFKQLKEEQIQNLDPAHMDNLLEDHKRIFRAVVANYHAAIWHLAGVEDPAATGPCWGAIRRLKTDCWLRLVEQIENIREPNHKPETMFTHVPAPLGYPSGGAPSGIADPNLRKPYEELVRRNSERNARLLFEGDLQRLATEAEDFAVRYLQQVYQKTPADAKELAGYLDSLTDAKLKAEMQEKLKDLLPPETK